MMSNLMVRNILIPILVTAFFISCDSNSTSSVEEQLELGTFIGQVGEDPNTGLYEELGGHAFFYLNEEEHRLEIALESFIVSSEFPTYIYLFIQPDSMPTVGSFNLREVEDFDLFSSTEYSGMYLSREIIGYPIFSLSGEIEISNSSIDGIKGKLTGLFYQEFSTGPDEFTRRTTRVSAEFNAMSSDSSKFIE